VIWRDFGQRHLLGYAGIGYDHVHLALRASDNLGDTVDVCELGQVRRDSADVGADKLHRLVERFLASSGDDDMRTLLHESLGDGESDAAVSTGNNGDLAF
jgi:hypothetical protein